MATGNITQAALAASGVVIAAAGQAAPAIGIDLVPDFRAMLIYGGWGASVAVAAALWRKSVRGVGGSLGLSVVGFLVGASVGAGVAENMQQPNTALLATMLISLILPQFILRPIETLSDMRRLLAGDAQRAKASGRDQTDGDNPNKDRNS